MLFPCTYAQIFLSVSCPHSHNLCCPISGRHQVSRPFKQQIILYFRIHSRRWSQWPRGLKRGSAAASLLRLWVRIPPGACMFVSCECCVLSLQRADHSSRGVLPTVVRRVLSRNVVNEEALAHWGAVAPKTNKQFIAVAVPGKGSIQMLPSFAF